MYEYSVKLNRVIDGDTVAVNVDLGFTVCINIEFRLSGINAPEARGATKSAGIEAKEHLVQLLGQGTLSVRSEKPLRTDKYGRWLARITVAKSDGTSFDAGDQMVADGFAVTYMA